MNRLRSLPSLRLATLMLVIAAVMAVAFVVDLRPMDAAFEITELTVVAGGRGQDSLVFAGKHGGRTLNALLLPRVVTGEGALNLLGPHIPFSQLDTDGSLAMASTRDRRVVVIDVQDGRPPRILGSVEVRKKGANREDLITNGVLALIKLGTRAVVSLSNGDGLVLLDLTDPYAPRELDYLPLAIDATDLLAINGQVIAAGVRSGLWQVRIDGDRLRVAKLPGMQTAWRLARDGDRLVAASVEGDLAFFEVDGAKLPRLVGRMNLPGALRGVTISRDVLHVCMADGTLFEYAAAPWPNFAVRGQLRLPGRPLRLVRAADSPLLLCALVGVGAAIVDTSHPGLPAVTGWLASGSSVADLAIVGDRVLFTSNKGLQTKRLSHLDQQLHVEFPLESQLKQVRLQAFQGEAIAYDATRLLSLGRTQAVTSAATPSGEDLLVLRGDNCVRLYARRGEALVQIASQPVKGPVRAAFWRNGRLFALNDTTLEVFSCDESGACQPVGSLVAFEHGAAFAWVDPHYLLVADRHAGIKLVDVGGTGEPRIVAQLGLPAFLKRTAGIQDVLVSEQFAYVARGEFGVQIIDLAGLPAMKVTQLIDTPGRALSLTMHEGLLLVADLGKGIQVIDTREPRGRLVGSLGTPIDALDMVVQGQELLVSARSNAMIRMLAPMQLGAVRAADADHGQVTLPAGLPAGRYQLIVYDDSRLARADFTVP